LLISQVRPTFLSPAELRESTGLPVLGTVSMNWTDAENAKRKRGQYTFAIATVCLFLVYGGMLATTFSKT
jgi:hypothetical protein